MAKLMIVDDESTLRHSLQVELRRLGYDCHAFEMAEQALHHIEENIPDLALVDIRLPDMDGLELIRKMKKEGYEFPVIVMTGFASISNVVAAMKEGAINYIEKPVDLEQLALIIQRSLEDVQLKGRLELFERTAPFKEEAVELIGQNEEFLKLVSIAKRIAAPEVKKSADLPTILLLGETGTGKDLLARVIHQNSPVSREPFVQLNCAALPRELIESELFGFERGAFTDAKSSKKGLLEIADQGTVFMDEIGELPVELQAKLLSALETRQFRRLGGIRDRQFKSRLIAATNADLVQRIKKGSFREDLFYRLNVFTMSLPPLRERGDDIELLARHFISKFARKYRKKGPELARDAIERLKRYRWPGNIRELSHVIENATLLDVEGVIRSRHLGFINPAEPDESARTSPQFDILDPECTLAGIEEQLIRKALEHTDGNVSEAAKVLGLSRGALRRRLQHIDFTR